MMIFSDKQQIKATNFLIKATILWIRAAELGEQNWSFKVTFYGVGWQTVEFRWVTRKLRIKGYQMKVTFE